MTDRCSAGRHDSLCCGDKPLPTTSSANNVIKLIFLSECVWKHWCFIMK